MTGNFAIKQNGNGIFDLWEVITDESNVAKQPTVYRFEEDPLAYLVKWQNCKQQMDLAFMTYGTPGRMLMDISGVRKKFPELVKLEPVHRKTADDIREYYKAKLVNLGLRGERLTDFRRRLYDVANNTKSITEPDIGILCKLPEFYAEDTFMDQLLGDSASLPNKLVNRPVDVTFEYVGSNDRRTRYRKQRRYWFRSPNGYLAAFFVDLNGNAALPVLDQYLEPGCYYHIRCESGNTIMMTGQDADFRVYYLNQYDIEKTKP